MKIRIILICTLLILFSAIGLYARNLTDCTDGSPTTNLGLCKRAGASPARTGEYSRQDMHDLLDAVDAISTGGFASPYSIGASGLIFTGANSNSKSVQITDGSSQCIRMRIDPTDGPLIDLCTAGDWKMRAPSGTHVYFLDSTTNGVDFTNGTMQSTGTGRIIADNLITKSIVLYAPTTGDSASAQLVFANAVTLTRVWCSTDTGTTTINLEERSESTPNTAGTASLNSNLVCDTDSQVTTSFADSAIAARAPYALTVIAVASSPGVVRVHIEAQE